MIRILVTVLSLAASASAITISTVPIGNPSNAANRYNTDSEHPNGVGSVAQLFNIGTTEVTNAQYAAFLSAVAGSDTYGLYSTRMASDTCGGIVRSGSSPSYTYAVKTPALNGTYTYDNKPVVFVSSGDAMRFANWLHNRQPTGGEDSTTTEDGAYTLNGATTSTALAAVTRNANPRWWLPSEDEWYKAAYYDPGTGTYFNYPTRTSTVVNNHQPSSDTGNSANFFGITYTTGNSSFPFTDAGAYTLSSSPYGTFDQGGNAWEWDDTPLQGISRFVRGGSWSNNFGYLEATAYIIQFTTSEANNIGFRVASAAVPEPSTLLLSVSIFALLATRRCRK
jgi:sulfatase modifying factor 1